MTHKNRKKTPQGEFQTQITALSHDGRGIAHINGKITFINNALPGETVQYHYVKCLSQFDEAQAVTIVSAAAERTEPACSHFGICGGCNLQHYSHPAQLIHKQKTLLEMLHHQADIQTQQVLPPITGKPYGYRHKARLGVKYLAKKNKVLVGFRERNGRYLADCNQCWVLHPAIGHKISELSTMLHQLAAKAVIPQIEIAIGDDRNAIILRHLQPLPEQDLQILKQFCQQHHLHLYLQPQGIDSIHLVYPTETNPLLYYQLKKYHLTLYFSPQQFTQINPEVNQKMLEVALELLDLQEHETALDLFCGIGNFSLAMAQHCKAVIGVEGDSSSVKQAEYNASHNNIANCHFYQSNLFADCSDHIWTKQIYNKILLDPPRCGAKEILPWVMTMKPERIVYVSCNASTLARDAALLVEHHYQLTHAGIIDMFPHTQHVENIALFQLKKRLIHGK